MRLLKCADCGKEISISSDKCPYCGSKKQFKGYTFSSKEIRSMGLTRVGEINTFQKCGGKIKIVNWKKFFKIIGIIFLIFFVGGTIIGFQKVDYTLDDGTVVQITNFELEKIKEKEKKDKRVKELLKSIKELKPFQYSLRLPFAKELAELKPDKYKKAYEIMKTVDDKKWDCIARVQERDKSRALIKDSFEIIYGTRNRLEGWTSNNTYTYVYQYKVKNPFGVELTHVSSNQCIYDENFNIIKVVKKN